MPSHNDRMTILERLERGEITPDEAAKLLSTEAAPAASDPTPSESAMDVLGKVERGEINADQAAQRLQNGEPSQARAGSKTFNFQPSTFNRIRVGEDRFDPARTWGWWFVPIAIGTLFAVLAGLWMNADARDGSLGLGFLCAWFPLAIGIAFIVFGVAARRGPWANLWINKRRRSGDVDVILNVPVPVGMAGTVLRTAGPYIPGLEEADVDKLMDALGESRKRGERITIHTKQDNEDEDTVDISLG